MYTKINNEGAKKALVSISIMVIIIAFTSSVVVSLVPLSSIEGDRESNNPLGFKSIKKFDNNGKFIASWGSEGYGDGQYLHLHDVNVDASGNLYVTDQNNFKVEKLTSDGNFITKWGSEGCNDGQFREHHGIDFDSVGNVYIVDTQNERIQKFDSNGKFIASWGSEGYGDGQFWLPHDIAIDSSDNVYVTDSGNVHEKKDNCTI